MLNLPDGWTRLADTHEGTMQIRHNETGKHALVSHLHFKVDANADRQGLVDYAIRKAEIEIARDSANA